MTASGMDPKLLTRVPACARLPIAAAPTLPDAFALIRTYERMDEEEARERLLLD